MRDLLYGLANDSVPVYAVEHVDANGIPFVDYKTLKGVTPGKQYNPTIICNYAIDYFRNFSEDNDSTSLSKFYNCARWLANNFTLRDNYALYRFNWQQPWYDSVRVPYTSGMTSGLAIKVFCEAYSVNKSAAYLAHAKLLARGFFVPINKGGFTYKDKDGWWYEELADTMMHTPSILDGHIFAITGLHEYITITGDDSAIYIFNKGIEVLKNRLPAYDAGNGWSLYDAYKLPADRKYHRTLTAQMKELYTITGDKFFLGYFNKWNEPLDRWYIRRIVEDRNISGMVLFIILWSFVLAVIKVAADSIRIRRA